MKKLELKHLAPYLPYGLNIEILNYKSDYVGEQYASITGFYNFGANPHFTYEGGSTGKSVKEFKPILRPLSDLTKEIEINGEKIRATFWLSKHFKDVEEAAHFLAFGKTKTVKHLIENLPYKIIVKLFEWHFDVFGLIPVGLAIDINTLDK